MKRTLILVLLCLGLIIPNAWAILPSGQSSAGYPSLNYYPLSQGSPDFTFLQSKDADLVLGTLAKTFAGKYDASGFVDCRSDFSNLAFYFVRTGGSGLN